MEEDGVVVGVPGLSVVLDDVGTGGGTVPILLCAPHSSSDRLASQQPMSVQ